MVARVDQGFSVAELLTSVSAVIDGIGFPEVELSINPENAMDEAVGSGQAAIDFRISTTDGWHSTTVSSQDFGDPDNPEFRRWVTVPHRGTTSPSSYRRRDVPALVSADTGHVTDARTAARYVHTRSAPRIVVDTASHRL